MPSSGARKDIPDRKLSLLQCQNVQNHMNRIMM